MTTGLCQGYVHGGAADLVVVQCPDPWLASIDTVRVDIIAMEIPLEVHLLLCFIERDRWLVERDRTACSDKVAT